MQQRRNDNLYQLTFESSLDEAAELIGEHGKLECLPATSPYTLVPYRFVAGDDAGPVFCYSNDIMPGGYYKLVGIQMDLCEDTLNPRAVVLLSPSVPALDCDRLAFHTIDDEMWECATEGGMSIVIGATVYADDGTLQNEWKWSVMYSKEDGGPTGFSDNRYHAIRDAVTALAVADFDVSLLPCID